MFKALLWFSLGYATCRYLILRAGVDAYLSGEKEVISGAKDKIDDFSSPEESYSQFHGQY